MAESDDEPHLTIDSYNSLYILYATKNEEGVYTCFADDKKMQNYTIKIVSKSKLLNDGKFLSYFFISLLYLGTEKSNFAWIAAITICHTLFIDNSLVNG